MKRDAHLLLATEYFESLAMAGAGLTRQQKNDLAFAVIRLISNLVEFPEMLPDSCRNVDHQIIKNILRGWAARIPGDKWDPRLD